MSRKENARTPQPAYFPLLPPRIAGQPAQRMSRNPSNSRFTSFAAALWILFLIWSAWTAVVWCLPIGPARLGFSALEDAPPPPNADLRRAVLILAENASLAWLALAVIVLHLAITRMHGLRTARAWLGITTAAALGTGILNAHTGLPFGWMAHYPALGARIAGTGIGWLLLWFIVIAGSREALLWLRPRASHATACIAAAALAGGTFANILAIATHQAWWSWHTGSVREPAAMPAWAWAAWFLLPLAILLVLRESNISTASARRPARPLIIIAILNALALALRIRFAA